jgi:phenylacetate-CoA ligase
LYLIDWCHERGIDPAKLGVRRFSVAGEPGGGETAIRERLQSAFGATVNEAMGIANVSPSIWGECFEQQGMHWSGRDFVHVEADRPELWRPNALGRRCRR